MSKNTQSLATNLYPLVEKSLNSNLQNYKAYLSTFIDKRSKDVFDTVPCSRIYYSDEDRKEFLSVLNITEDKIQFALDNTYYSSIANFNPRAAKDPTTVTCLMCIRYFLIHKMQKELEIACIYMAFSGKLYPSLQYRSFPIEPARYVMEYVVNNKLGEKYDIVSKGSVFAAVKSICNTWINSYDDKIKSKDDEDMVYVIQQLHNRIGSFMKNIAKEYYEAYQNKEYITYDSDNVASEDDFHLADSDSLKAERVIAKTMEKINTSRVDYKICKMASDSNIRVDELQSIIESILLEHRNNALIKEFITILVNTYFVQSKTKDVRDIDFITYSIAPKPNTKDKYILRSKEIIEQLLCENSKAYIRRRSRLATKNSYYRAITMYFTLLIHYSNK